MKKICALIMLAVLCLPGAAQAYYFEVTYLTSTTSSAPDELINDSHGDQVDFTVNAASTYAALSGTVIAQFILHEDSGVDTGTPVNATLTDTSFYNAFPAGTAMTVNSTVDLAIRSGEDWSSLFQGIDTSYSETVVGAGIGQSASDLDYFDLVLVTGIPYQLTFTYSNDFAGLYQVASREVSIDLNQAPTPIPGAAWLLGSGLVGLVAMRKRFFA